MEAEKKKLNFKICLITGLISLGVGGLLFLILFLLKGKTLFAATNATSFVGIILISIMGLIYVAREGFFDIFSYGFKQVKCMVFDKKANAENDFPAYKQQQRTKREKRSDYYLIIGLVGCLFMVAYSILRILLEASL